MSLLRYIWEYMVMCRERRVWSCSNPNSNLCIAGSDCCGKSERSKFDGAGDWQHPAMNADVWFPQSFQRLINSESQLSSCCMDSFLLIIRLQMGGLLPYMISLKLWSNASGEDHWVYQCFMNFICIMSGIA